MPTPASSIEPIANTATFVRADGGNPDAPTRDLNRRPAVETPDERPLPTIPGYRIVSRLGRGGMGEVFEAVNARGHTVALKMIRRDRVSKTTIERFGREADAMFDLHHSNIAHFFTYDVEPDGTPYFTMKYVDGGTLAERIEEFQGDYRKMAALMIKVLEAVQFLHDKGFIHRDLKPHNILLDRAGQPYVSDFGLVKDLDDLLDLDDLSAAVRGSADTDPHFSRAETAVKIAEDARVPLTAGVIGTLPYASPEQLRNDKNSIGPATDIWALGVILYELACGARPFDSGDPIVLSSLIRTEVPQPPTVCKPGMPPEIERVILKCLSKEPLARYPSATAMSADLSQWLGVRPAKAKSHTRRNFLAAAIPCAAIGTAAFVVGRRDREVPKPTTLEGLNRELAETGHCDLIVNGWPRWSKIIAGDEDCVGIRGEDRMLALQPGLYGASFIDLATDIAIAPYRFCVLLRHEGDGAVGTYTCRTMEWSAGDAYHVFVAMAVGDFTDPLEGAVTMGVNCIAAHRPSGFLSPPHIRQIKLPKPKGGWRRIVLEVSSLTVGGVADAVRVANPPRSYLLKKVADLAAGRPEMNGLTATFPAIGALGLFAMNGNLLVKSAWLERIT